MVQPVAGLRDLGNAGCRLGRDRGDALDAARDVFAGGRLFVAGRRDLVDQIDGVLRALNDVAERCAGLVGQADALFDFRRAALHGLDGLDGLGLDAFDHRSDLFSGAGGAFGQLAHLVGHDGKAAALLTGTGRLDGGVERQQVRLVGYFVDDRDDLADLIARRTEPLNGLGGGTDDGGPCR